MIISREPELGDHALAPIEHRSSVRGLMRINPDREHHDPLTITEPESRRGGTVLMRVVARACFEPHHAKNPAVGHFVHKPTQTVDRRISRPTTEALRRQASGKHSTIRPICVALEAWR